MLSNLLKTWKRIWEGSSMTTNDDIKMAKKDGVVYREYTLDNDVQQAIIHVYSEESYPSSRRRSVENISAYYEKLQDLYRRVFQVAQDNNKSIVRVPMIGGGVKMGKEKITKDIVKQIVAQAEAEKKTQEIPKKTTLKIHAERKRPMRGLLVGGIKSLKRF